MKPFVYLETSFLSYVASLAHPTSPRFDHIRASQEWWRRCRADFHLGISQPVVDECLQGNADAVRRRAALLNDLTLLDITNDISLLARRLVAKGCIPAKVFSDALHIACAAVYECDFLLTWNFKHINNPFQLRHMQEIIEKEYGYRFPIICTPEPFL